MARVEELADRREGEKSPRARRYQNMIPLPEIIGDAKNQRPGTKAVEEIFSKLLAGVGNELFILQEGPLSEIERVAGIVVAEGIRRMRGGEVKIAAGYDGEYGTIHLFTSAERERFSTQVSLLEQDSDIKEKNDKTKKREVTYSEAEPTNVLAVRDGTTAFYKTQNNESPASNLNPSQYRAVINGRDHLLIVAGPGTGKTHVLTHRINYVIENFAKPEEILAITFTNKAAEEMRQRLTKLIGSGAAKLTIGTFHAFCLGLLREYCQAADLPPNFEIISADAQAELAKELWPEKAAAERNKVLEEISRLKSCDNETSENDLPRSAWRRDYDLALRRNGQLDFDDLLLEAIRLLNIDEVKNSIHQRYHWIFVDEYQDINSARHQLLKLLVHTHAALTAIGDPNQAIYGFRGADVNYFSQFAEDFAPATELQLVENYRSGPTILSASAQVIEAGRDGFAMPLSPTLLTPGRLTIHAAPTEKAEAEYVVHQIEKMIGGTSMFSQDSGRVEKAQASERSFGDFVVLYRLNALRAAFEEALERSGMPYQISGDEPLLARRGVCELATAIRWLCRLAQPELAIKMAPQPLARLLHFAVNGIGEQTAQRAEKFFKTIHHWEADALEAFLRQEQNLTEKQKLALIAFSCELQEASRRFEAGGLAAALQFLFNLHTWKNLINLDKKLGGNFQRVINLARRYDSSDRRDAVRNFFDALVLESSMDHFETKAEKIALMTLHAAKGLEFPVVFIAGCEETLLPMQLIGLTGNIEEERRLFYVGMTRAKEQLYLLRAKRRGLFGRLQENPPSRFLADIAEQLKAYEKWQAPKRKEPTPRGDDNQLGLF
jgi:superfamily I DNA/RNA helicase